MVLLLKFGFHIIARIAWWLYGNSTGELRWNETRVKWGPFRGRTLCIYTPSVTKCRSLLIRPKHPFYGLTLTSSFIWYKQWAKNLGLKCKGWGIKWLIFVFLFFFHVLCVSPRYFAFFSSPRPLSNRAALSSNSETRSFLTMMTSSFTSPQSCQTRITLQRCPLRSLLLTSLFHRGKLILCLVFTTTLA